MFVVLIGGTIVSLIVGVATGTLAVSELFTVVGSGVTGMYDITVISIVVACIVSLVKEYGGIQFILNLIRNGIKGKKGAEIGIAGLSLMVDACTANNTVAIVMANPIASEMAKDFDISPRKTASILDTFSCIFQGFLPYGAQILVALSVVNTLGYEMTAFQIIANLFYPMLLLLSSLLFIFVIPDKKK